MPLLVRNMAEGPTVFSDPTTNVAIEWERRGHPDGEDLQQVSDTLVENVNFLKCVQRGILKVEEAPEALREAIEKQTAAYERRSTMAAQNAQGTIDQAAHNDIVTTPGIGPNNRGTGECGGPGPVREKTKDEHPPLCERHQQHANQFVLEETDKIVDGKAQKHWLRVGMDARDRQPV